MPPGWSAWHTVLKADTDHYYYGYTLNNNGVVEGPYGDSGTWEPREYSTRDDIGCPFAPLNGQPCFYETDMLTNLATQELRNTPEEQPFYLQLDYTAPHGDFRKPAGPEPAPRHYDWFKGAPLPHNRGQGFDEGNVTDKPSFIREAPYLGLSEIHTYRVYYDKALESLRSIDDGVKLLIDTLGSLHRLRNTYVIFTSDNGFFYGEHRLIGGKFLAYEPSTHLPFLIRGPHIKAGTESGEIVGNIDVAPTILELAGVDPRQERRRALDDPLLQRPRTAHPAALPLRVLRRNRRRQRSRRDRRTRRPEQRRGAPAARRPARAKRRPGAGGGASASLLAPPKDYEGIRLGPYKYIAWPDGEKELYDLEKDPYELNNLVRIPNYFPVRNFLHRELTRTARGLRRPRLPRRSRRNPADAPRTPAGDPRRSRRNGAKNKSRTEEQQQAKKQQQKQQQR